ncbi:polyketide cyclase [bacterium]|nr:MAG: polyketide cyclase [bacterium]
MSRLVDAPRELIYKAWTTPELLMKWFVPKPWSLARAEIDPRPGGVFLSVMQDPDGKEYPNEGVFLECGPDKIVFTDAFTRGWMPNPDPFMVAIVTFEEEDGKTLYTARVRHWTVEAKEKHEQMGFHDGWGAALTQLEELLPTLA